MVGFDDEPSLYTPPPYNKVLFRSNRQLNIVGEEFRFAIPPPDKLAEFPENVQLVMVGEDRILTIPPP
jgi:hypothetical protein